MCAGSVEQPSAGTEGSYSVPRVLGDRGRLPADNNRFEKKVVDYGTREVSECPFPVLVFDFIPKENKKLTRNFTQEATV